MSKLGRTSKSFIARIKNNKDDSSTEGASSNSNASSSGPKTSQGLSRSKSKDNSANANGESKMSAFAAKMSKGGNKLSKSFYLAQQQVLSKTGNAEITQDSAELALYTERADVFKTCNKEVISKFEGSEATFKASLTDRSFIPGAFASYSDQLPAENILVSPLQRCAEMETKIVELQRQYHHDTMTCLVNPLFEWNRGDVREARYAKRDHDQLRVEHDAMLHRYQSAREKQSTNLKQIEEEYHEVKQRFETSSDDCLQHLREVDERNEILTGEKLIAYMEATRLFFERGMTFFWELEQDMDAFKEAIRQRKEQVEELERVRKRELEMKRGVVDEKTRVFGVELDLVMQRPENEDNEVPVLVEKCIEYLNDRALTSEGIFRLSGGKKQIDETKYSLDMGEDVEWSEIKDPNVVAGLLKVYIRELPIPLLTYELYDDFVRVGSLSSQEEMVDQLIELINKLPDNYRNLLDALMELCGDIAEESDVNMMHAANLAIVFAPNILKPESDDLIGFGDTSAVNAVVKTLIDEYSLIFGAQTAG